MKVFEYSRVSTKQQDFEQQHNTVAEYCAAHNLDIHKTMVDEGVSGSVSYKDRSLIKLLDMMGEGDLLIVSEISRLGRSMSDLSQLVSQELKPRKLKLVAVKSGINLNCDVITAVDEFILNALAFAAQMEKELIATRTQSKLDVIKSEIASGEGHVVQKGRNKGKVIHSLGNGGKTVAIAQRASCEAKKRRARSNPHNQMFCKLLKTYTRSNPMITCSTCGGFVDLLNEWNALTSTGLPFTEDRCWSMYRSLKRQGIL